MKVKVCGITSYEDAAMALDHGVDALGFNFYRPSPRFIHPTDARRIIGRLPPFAISVGLFVNLEHPDEVADIAQFAGVQVLQLHGDETPEYCRQLSDWPLIKALRVGEGPFQERIEEYPVRAFLLDSRDEKLFGGTGKAFDWTRAKEVRAIKPVILAGGLRPENVREAVRTVKPYGLDVCSGVESVPGKKDSGKLAQFMNEVRDVCISLPRP